MRKRRPHHLGIPDVMEEPAPHTELEFSFFKKTIDRCRPHGHVHDGCELVLFLNINPLPVQENQGPLAAAFMSSHVNALSEAEAALTGVRCENKI